MTSHSAFPLVAVDVGNSRVKLGYFPTAPGSEFPEPQQAISLGADWDPAGLASWAATIPADAPWHIASVNRTVAARLTNWLKRRGATNMILLTAEDLPIELDVEHPSAVGIDRVASAVAVNKLRQSGHPAIVIDVGSAITVDLVSSNGHFRGGAILPGIAMSARALHEFTDLLPLLPDAELGKAPAVLGRSTTAAIRSGMFWGAVGAIGEIVDRMGADELNLEVFLTGGAAPSVTELVRTPSDTPARFVAHLTLGGIALAAVQRAKR